MFLPLGLLSLTPDPRVRLLRAGVVLSPLIPGLFPTANTSRHSIKRHIITPSQDVAFVETLARPRAPAGPFAPAVIVVLGPLHHVEICHFGMIVQRAFVAPLNVHMLTHQVNKGMLSWMD